LGFHFSKGKKKKICASIIWRVLGLISTALLSCHLGFWLSVELEEMPTLNNLLNASAFKAGGGRQVCSTTAWVDTGVAQREPDFGHGVTWNGNRFLRRQGEKINQCLLSQSSSVCLS